MSKLIILSGMPASGKSTYAESLKESYVVLSSDKIRKELLGDEKNQIANDLVFKTLYKRANDLLRNKFNVVIDSTAINKFERKRMLENFKEQEVEKVCVFIETDFEECVKRDKQRDRVVGEDVLKLYFERVEKPTLEEGFDEVIIIDGKTFKKKKDFNA